MKVKSHSRVQLFVTPWTIAYEAPLSMGFSTQEYWSGLPFPSPGHGFMNPPVNAEAHILLALPKMYMITSTQFRNPKGISCLFLFLLNENIINSLMTRVFISYVSFKMNLFCLPCIIPSAKNTVPIPKMCFPRCGVTRQNKWCDYSFKNK